MGQLFGTYDLPLTIKLCYYFTVTLYENFKLNPK